MATFRVDTVFPMFTGRAEDIVMNTLHFENATLTTEQFAASVPVLLDPFWTTIYGTPASGRVTYIDWPNVKYRVFNLNDITPRVPVEADGPFTDPGGNQTQIPTEVSVVASFKSQGLPGEVYQRRYNRIFLGCIPDPAIQDATLTDFPRIDASFRTKVITAMVVLADAAPGPNTLWVQVSNATGSLRTLPVIGGWVDNTPDTQRRRGVESTLRDTWATP